MRGWRARPIIPISLLVALGVTAGVAPVTAAQCIPGPTYTLCLKDQRAIGQVENGLRAAQQQEAQQRAQQLLETEQRVKQEQQQQQLEYNLTQGQLMRQVPQIGGSVVPQGPPQGPVTVVFRGNQSVTPGYATVTVGHITCPPDCTFYFAAGQNVGFNAQADSQSVVVGFDGCVWGGSTAPRTAGNTLAACW